MFCAFLLGLQDDSANWLLCNPLLTLGDTTDRDNSYSFYLLFVADMSEPVSFKDRISAFTGVLTHPPTPLQTKTWRTFWDKVMIRLPVPQRLTFQVSVERRAQAEGYFAEMIRKTARLRSKNEAALEQDVVEECLDILVRFSNQVWEEVGNSVRDFSSTNPDGGKYKSDERATRLRNMAFVRDPKAKGDRYDYICTVPRIESKSFPSVGIMYKKRDLNVKFKEQDNIISASGNSIKAFTSVGLPVLPFTKPTKTKPLPTLTKTLPVDRACPFNIDRLMEIKKLNFPLGKPVAQQLGHYLECLIRITPGRNVAFGVATNMGYCMFVAVVGQKTKSGISFRCFNSDWITAEEMPTELGHFCATSPEAMGMDTAFFHNPDFAIEDFLGRGSSGAVLQCTWKETTIALKVSLQTDALDVERAFLKYLQTRGVLGVLRVHIASQEILFQQFRRSCTTFDTV